MKGTSAPLLILLLIFLLIIITLDVFLDITVDNSKSLSSVSNDTEDSLPSSASLRTMSTSRRTAITSSSSSLSTISIKNETIEIYNRNKKIFETDYLIGDLIMSPSPPSPSPLSPSSLPSSILPFPVLSSSSTSTIRETQLSDESDIDATWRWTGDDLDEEDNIVSQTWKITSSEI